MPDTDRPQDVGRSRRRRGQPSPETAALLERYRRTLRDQLTDTLDQLGAHPAPALADRVALLRVARQLAGELASGDDSPGRLHTAASSPGATRGAPPRLTRRDRARLG